MPRSIMQVPSRLILNCDDLGISVPVNDCILDLMEQRRVTSATVMMNAPATEDAAKRLQRYPHCSFGVHLVGTEFKPLTAHPGLAPLLNQNGEFAGNLRRIPITPAIQEGIFAEWCAQMDRALVLGIPISHIDSHHHVHTEPKLLRVLKRIQKRYGVRKIRITWNVFGVDQIVSRQVRMSKFAWNFALRHYIPTITTDAFASFETFHERLLAGKGWNGTIELMCHPGSELFEHETQLLRGNWKQELASNAQLISYNEL